MKIGKQIISILLALAVILSLCPQVQLRTFAAERNTPQQMQKLSPNNGLKGKKLSVLGASISTYTGISNNPDYNSTIGNNAVYYTAGKHGVYAGDTWWMQAAEDLGLELLVNNSWSGSSLLHERNGTVGAYVDRCVQLHNNEGEMPDIIGIQMGTNDFQYYKDTLGTADIDYDTLITSNGDGTYTYATPVTSLEAAAIVLHKISVRYPNAEVYYLNISQRVDDTDELIRSFNAELKQVVEHFGAHIVDIYGSAITMDDFDTYIGDGRVHPNKLGMDAYTEAFKRALLENTAYQVDTHTVTMELDGVTADYGDDKIVVSGDSFAVNLTASDSLQVSVTMGGEDITASSYANGTVTIDAVTADVTVTAKSVHAPKEYRWEFNGTDLVCTEGGNTLTKNAGTTTDGVFSKTRYALADSVVLLHNQPWVVEWKCSGTFLNANGSSGARIFTSDNVNANYNARYIFKSNTNGIIAMGEKDTNGSHNYGIALADHGIDWTELHTYRLENRIAADGSNMIYLLVDGEEIGPMNHYYIGTKDQNTTTDWLSGKDFVFPYMGTDTHGFTNASIDYIQVNECAHTYENGICTGCGEELSFDGKTVSILGDSISTYAGVSNNTAYNSTIGNNAVYYQPGTQGVYQADTWWQQTIDALGLELLVNNSWSGSAVLHTRRGTAGAYVDRCVQLHNDKTGEEPDIIVVYMGGNDFNYYQDTLGTGDIDYAALISENADGSFAYAEPVTTCEAYAIMLHKIQVRYPDADIYCMTSTPRRVPDKEDNYPDVGQPTVFNRERIKIATHFGCTVVDIENCGIPKEAEGFDQYIGDGRSHPNKAGMDLIAQALVGAMLGTDATLHDVSGEYVGVDTDNGAAAAVAGMGYTANLTPQSGYSDMSVSVTMDGLDVTETVYTNGTVRIENVTGDIVIKAVGQREPMIFRWELADGELVSTGETENEATKLAGTVVDGVLKDTRYQFASSVILKHDRPWVLEWKCAEDWRGVVLSTNPLKLAPGRCYLTRTKGGQLCFGSWSGTQYDNYGVDLSGLDSQSHTYRLENRIAADGSNMIWLYVDEAEIGPMNNYYVGSNAQNATSDWLSGRDFSFVYIGSDTTTLNNCALDYIQVHECVHVFTNHICTFCGAEDPNAVTESLSLRYDDHYDVTGKTVEIIDAGTPTSYKVGYGVAEGTLDDAVVTLEGNYLIATGIGAATVRIDGIIYDITVTAAPISLILLIGQSNMRGSEGNANQSIVCPDGMVYATYGDDRGADNTAMTVNNATMFAPSALTGEYSGVNVEGTTDCLSGYPVYSLTEAGAGKIGPDSGFAYEWVKQTGEKVWIVNAAHGGTSINVWQPGTTQYEECQALFTACQQTLQKEIAAGHYTLSHMGYFWCQGCSDRTQSAEWYVKKYLAMHESFKTELAFDHDSDPATADKTFEFGGIIPVRVGSTATCYRDGVYTDVNPYAYHESFVDLRFNGPRVAQYWMINNPDLPDIWGVCNIGEDWVWMPDGTNGVTEYFQAHYPDGRVDYNPQVAQKEAWYTPTTPKAVHDSIHYNQIGYNEIGRESVRNALIMLGEMEAPDVETTVELLSWDGYTQASQIVASTTGNSGTMVVPVVYPIWKSKDVTYELAEGLSWNYYDLLAGTAETEGILTAIGAEGTVAVVKAEPGNHFADHLSQLPEDVCCGLNLWNVLEHDKYYFESGTHWGIHSSGNVYSVTILVEAGEKIFATSWGKAGENGHATANGIRVSFFSEYGVAKTLEPAECYAKFIFNGGYLVVPEDAIAVNIAMWNNSDDNEIYILNRPHDTTSGICSICGKDSHIHEWSEWEMKEIPGKGEPVTEERSCSGCGETETREVESVWQKYDLAAHYSDLPETVCSGLNLWNVLEHDKYYFANGTNWSIYSGGNVYSVTIPVEAGEKIFATAWGKAGENGHATSNGIRTTFFSAYGVVKTMTPAECYAEFAANGGYLIAPEGAIAVNIAMWNNSDENEIYILNAAHDYEGTVTAPTCTEQGYTTYTCTICGDSYVDSYVAATGHSYGEWIIQTPAGCAVEGSRVRVCACGETEYEVISAVGHNYTPIVTAPTCTEQGYTTYTCACGDSYVDDVSMDITDRFKWNEGYVISAFNGNMMADKNWVASDYVDISAFESIEIVTGDTVNANTTLGIAFYDANKKFVSGVVHTDKTGTEYGILVHNLEVPQGVSYLRTTWYSVNHGSYNGATLHTFYCKGAGTAIPPLGHDYVLTEETKPNCSAGGTKVYICSRCGESTQETTSKGDHAYDNGICIGCGSSILGNDWIAPNFAEGDYSMVVLPDTQKLVTSWEDTYYEQMQWIADNEDALNIQAVLHMGDMVDNNTAREWTICEAGTDILQNAGIPWMPMRGNHDDADYFNNYYDYTTYGTNQSWFGGAYHSDKLEHTYWFVTVGQREYMILSLGWAPSWDVLAWAQDIVEAHSDKNVILTCHAYMNSDGTLLDSSDAHCPSSYHPGYPDGDDVWDAFKGYENVVLAMGGHIHSANIVTFVDQNGTGRDVTSLLVDRQNDDMANHYGMVAVLTFHNGSNTVDVNWYSVRYDALYRAKNQFSIDVPHVHSHEYVADITVPTCTQQGYTTYTCTCGDSYVDGYVDATGHSYGEWYVVTEATCTAEGQKRHDCANCDHYETEAINATGHSYEAVVTAPICTEQGYTTYTCECGDSYVDSYVPAVGHKFGDWVVTTQPTCTTNGVQRRDCDNCDHYETDIVAKLGHNLTQNAAKEPTCTAIGWVAYETCSRCDYSTYVEISATGHSYETVVTAPTCTAQGFTTYTCHCGDSYVDGYVDALGHTEVIDAAVADTCTTTGLTEGKHCSRCGKVLTAQEAVPAKGHSYETTVIAPTCTEQGYTTHTCTACGDSYVDSYVSATGHSLGNWYVTVAATCTEKGNERRDCANCEHFEEREVVALGHDLGTWYTTIESTCTGKGQEKRDCARCDYFETSAIEAKGHNYEAVVTEPACTSHGYTTYTCHCGSSYVGEYVDALGHSYDAVVTPPGCLTQGYTTYTCIRCAQSYRGDIQPATGHTYGEWIVRVEPTCTVRGERYRQCSGCGRETVEIISATGHSYTATVVAPTCTQPGYTNNVCHCGNAYVTDRVNALGHAYVEHEAKAPTCMENGWDAYETCQRCDYSTYKELPTTGHKYEAVVTEPTWETGGYTTYTCAGCGDSYVSDYTDPLLYIPGDADNNGTVNTDDAICLLYNVMFGDEDYPVIQNCDFDGSGAVNTDDAIYLLYHVMFGGEDYPLHS